MSHAGQYSADLIGYAGQYSEDLIGLEHVTCRAMFCRFDWICRAISGLPQFFCQKA